MDPLTIAVVAFAGLTVLATILSIDPGQSLAGQRLTYQGLLSTLAYAVLFVAARRSIASMPRVQGVALGLTRAPRPIVATYAIAQSLSLDPIWTTLYKDRPFSTMGQASALASVLGMAILLSLSLVIGRPRRVQAIVLAAAAVCATGLALTLSRGGYLGIVAGVVVAGLVLAAGRRRSVPGPACPERPSRSSGPSWCSARSCSCGGRRTRSLARLRSARSRSPR